MVAYFVSPCQIYRANEFTLARPIAVNGISLTVAEISQKSFAVWILPHTKAQTNLGTKRVDDLVDLEFDLIAKYLGRSLDRHVIGSE